MNGVHLELSFSAVYRHTPEAVWAALTHQDALRTWFLENDFSPRVGHAFFVWGPNIGHVNCVVVALEAPRRMEWAGHSAEFPIPTRVIFTLKKTDGGTRLTVKHVGVAPQASETDIFRGWSGRLNRLSRWLDGRFLVSVARGDASNVGLIANQASTNKTADRYAEEGAMTAITAASTDHEQVIDLTGKVRGARDLNERRRLSPPDQAHDVCSDHSH